MVARMAFLARARRRRLRSPPPSPRAGRRGGLNYTCFRMMKKMWQSHEEPERQKFYELGNGYHVGLQLYNGEVVVHVRVYSDGAYGLIASTEGCKLTVMEFKMLQVRGTVLLLLAVVVTFVL